MATMQRLHKPRFCERCDVQTDRRYTDDKGRMVCRDCIYVETGKDRTDNEATIDEFIQQCIEEGLNLTETWLSAKSMNLKGRGGYRDFKSKWIRNGGHVRRWTRHSERAI